jgi:lysophospholipase L1-like esterase
MTEPTPDDPGSRGRGKVPSSGSQADGDLPPDAAYPGADVPHDAFAVPDPPPGRRGRARDALVVVFLAALLLVLFQGGAVRGGAEELSPGVGRDVVEAFGEPTGWIADELPLAGRTDDALAWLETDGGPATPTAAGDRTLLVTGDSLAMPLDTELARRYAGGETAVERDAHVGTGISKSDLVDWRELAAKQVRRHDPDATVVFIGANEGFSLPRAGGAGQAQCCGADWQAAFAGRVKAIMRTYLRGGEGRVYWLAVPRPRDPARQEIADAVNAAVRAAAEAAGDGVTVLELDDTFAPDGDYADAIDVGGRERIVREQDGIHLNAAGAAVAADLVQDAVDGDSAR